MTKTYDVIIIGAGPSGSSCAYNLLKQEPSAQVLIVDKATFPRYKPCGGGVSPEVQNYLDFDLQPALDSVCNEVVMVANGRQVSSNEHQLWMVRREVFDDFLLAKARSLGAEFVAACEVTMVKRGAEINEVVTNQASFFAKMIVIAEGGRGKLAKKLGLDPNNQMLAALEYEHYGVSNLTHKLYVDFDYNDSGYAWNFPKADGLSLGIGGLVKGQGRGKVGLPQKLNRYSQQFGVKQLAKDQLHGHPIQLYSGKRKLVDGSIVLIGEIAGCVDPLTAEGIRPAIKTGFLAANWLALAYRQQDVSCLAGYQTDFYQQLGRDYGAARLMAYFLNRNLKRILPMLATPRAINAFMEVFSGKTTYRAKIHWRRILKLVWRSLPGYLKFGA